MSGWAWEMFDSNGRPEAGFSDGNNFWEGRFSQCNNVLHNIGRANQTDIHIRGRYFKAVLSGEMQQQSFRVTVGTCFPDLCTNSDVKVILNDAPGFMSLPKAMLSLDDGSFLADDVFGVDTEKRFWEDYTAVSALATVLAFVLLSLAGTIVDLCEDVGSDSDASPAKDSQSLGEQSKLVEQAKPASYSTLDQTDAASSSAGQP